MLDTTLIQHFIKCGQYQHKLKALFLENFSGGSHISGSLYYIIFQSCLVKHHLGHQLKIKISGLHLKQPDPDSQGDDPGNQLPASPQGFSNLGKEEKVFSNKMRHVLRKRCGHRLQGSNVCVCVCVYLCLCVQSCPSLCDPMGHSPPGSSVHGGSPGKNTGMNCHFLLQGDLLDSGIKPGSSCISFIGRQLTYH